MSKSIRKLSRRSVLKTLGIGLAATSSIFPLKFSIGAQAKLKIGTLLPYSGTYARLGEAITNAMELAFNEVGGKLGGREIEIVKIDSEAKPPKATENTTKLVASEKVDFIVGPVHSGVAMA
ncbi:MAG: ABC transporter permease, partial [Magnetovibrio sp.]|nr:ABC transporter permease [Magnetovibrio sp.]